MKKKKTKKEIFAFVHIEKAAGTSFNHILRKNFFLRYIDVRPLYKESSGLFQSIDLKKYFKINPFLACISGHAVTPYSDLKKEFSDIRFITLLRDPIKRYLSQFYYLVKINRIENDFENFLSNQEFNNIQTKKIAGSEDVEKAKSIITSEMFEVGVVEEFDCFLLRLKKSLFPIRFDPIYQKKNIIGKADSGDLLIEQYNEEIVARNKLDIDLYKYVVDEIIPWRNREYGPHFDSDLKNFIENNLKSKTIMKSYFDYIIRKAYYEPVTNYIRMSNNLPAKGSY